MKTTLDLPRPLLLRIVSRAARLGMPISRYVAQQLESQIDEARSLPSAKVPTESLQDDDDLFNALRDELGL